MYAPQTKILEIETTGRACFFDALCEDLYPKSSTHTLAKYVEKTRPTCCFVFQNLRFGEHKMVEKEIVKKEDEWHTPALDGVWLMG